MTDSNTSFKFGSGCFICKDVEIQGDVTIGNGTIIHPKARIIAEAGPIIIGDNNLIEDRALIWNKPSSDTAGSTPVMIIGNFNVFEVDTQCMALKVGDNNIIETKGAVGRSVVVSDGCFIGAACVLQGAETIPKNTAVYGSECRRALTQGHQTQALQLETLAKILPMYNEFKKRIV